MTDHLPARQLLVPGHDQLTPVRLARSALTVGDGLRPFRTWFAGQRQRTRMRVDRVALDRLSGWVSDPTTGNISHRSGRFFSVEGLEVDIPDGPVTRWSQPIIVQPEIGILGILVKEFDGVPHCLMQAKVEPGNRGGAQLAPTVQATRSNYTMVHQGRPVPYLDYFRDTSQSVVLSDVRQSEQGSWFHHKRNRNMVVEVTGDVEVRPGFRWMTLGLLHRLLSVDDLINMDARTVLSCLPFTGADLASLYRSQGAGFRAALVRSCTVDSGSLHSMNDILSWITGRRARTDIHTTRVPLRGLPGWRREGDRISHDSGLFFDVMAVAVVAGGREVSEWMQPMILPHGTGIVAFLTRSIGGVLHVLVHARVEPGFVDVVELAPTVQCTPENYDHLPAAARPPFLDEVLGADAGRIRFASLMSEEGGRFYHALNRYLVVETDLDPLVERPDFRWMTVHQLVDLLRHSNYVNVQARSLVSCLHGLASAGYLLEG